MFEVVIVTSVSTSFVPIAGVAFFSMMKNANPLRNYRLIILDDGINPNSKYLFKKSLEQFTNLVVDFFQIDKNNLLEHSFSQKNATNITVHTFYRLYLSAYFPNYSKILYLDPDTIILDDVAKIFDTDISQYHIGAIKDVNLSWFLEQDSAMRDYYHSLNLTDEDLSNFFNGGVQLQNLDLIRKDGIDKKIIGLLETRSFYWVVDQDIINLAVDKVYYFDIRWNRHGYSLCDISELIKENPAIIHYTTPSLGKPWGEYVFDIYAPIFWQYAKETLFYETLLAYPKFIDDLNRRTNPTKNSFLKSLLKNIIIKLGLQNDIARLKQTGVVTFIEGFIQLCVIIIKIPFKFMKLLFKKLIR